MSYSKTQQKEKTKDLKIQSKKKEAERRSCFSTCCRLDCFYELFILKFCYKESSVVYFSDGCLSQGARQT